MAHEIPEPISQNSVHSYKEVIIIKTNRSSATKAVLLPVIAFILCFVICFSVTYTVAHAATEGSNVTFTDVPTTHWAYNDITEAASLGFINGYGDGRFGPNDTLTREQWAALVTRVTGGLAETGDHYGSFTNANSSAWARPELVKYENMSLCSYTNKVWYHRGEDKVDSVFYRSLDYRQSINRAEAAAIVTGALAWTGQANKYNNPNAQTVGRQFPDIDFDGTQYRTPTATIDRPVKSWTQWGLKAAPEYVGICVNAGIINGYPDGTFGGENNLTRAEAAAMLMRLYRILPNDINVQKTQGAVKWTTNADGTQYVTMSSPYAPNATGNPQKFSKTGSSRFCVGLSTKYYTNRSMRDFIENMTAYTDYAFNNSPLQNNCIRLGIWEWNDPNDHSKGFHGKYGLAIYEAYNNHDDAALCAIIAQIENDHAENLALYDAYMRAVNGG